MARPLMLLDFDGVINPYGYAHHFKWDPERHYKPDNTRFPTVMVAGEPTRVGIRWNSDLAERLLKLMQKDVLDIRWLSTWQADTIAIDAKLGWPMLAFEPLRDGHSRHAKWIPKLDIVRMYAKAGGRPIVWVDDVECSPDALAELQDLEPEHPILMVGPDHRTGISRPQMALIERFARHPDAYTGVTLSMETGDDSRGREGRAPRPRDPAADGPES